VYVLFGNTAGKRPFWTCRHNWEHNIKSDVRRYEYVGMEWINLTLDRVLMWDYGNKFSNPITCEACFD
jgi:hypothetical protein